MAVSTLVFQRLCNQRLAGQPYERPEEVVRWMGAIQAQDYGQAVWAVGARTASATLVDVEQAIAERKMLRTWPMRGTIHFVPPENARWMLRLSQERMMCAVKRRQEQLELNEAILEKCKQLFYDALHGGRRLTRPAMMTLLENAGISNANQRGYHILWYAAITGLICIGPMQGKQQTFVLLDDWAPDARDLSREEVLATLAKSYFTGHGPATVQDFAWWAGLSVSEARAGLHSARQGLQAETIAGKEYWQPANAATFAGADPQAVHLLPGFDEYLLGYAERSAVLVREHFDRVIPGGKGVFKPILVTSGQVTGTWKRTIRKKALDVTVTPFIPLTIPEDDLQTAAQRYSQFVGLPLSTLTLE